MGVLHALERFFLMDFHTQVPFLISRLDNDIHRLYHPEMVGKHHESKH